MLDSADLSVQAYFRVCILGAGSCYIRCFKIPLDCLRRGALRVLSDMLCYNVAACGIIAILV